ncbi:MAG: DUF4231 domain-containing protein [Bacteroidetes bacterium]|nr:DUF4231 domain-containing protein [Bacteroidota bacterium]
MKDEQTYLKDRVDDQVNWLGDKAASNQKSYKRLRTISLVASVLIPFLSGFTDNYGLVVTITVGSLGAVLAICQGLLALNRYHENWTEYRMTAETLKREKLFYETKTGVYSGNGGFNLFVENAEKILAGENQKWLQTRMDAEGNGK